MNLASGILHINYACSRIHTFNCSPSPHIQQIIFAPLHKWHKDQRNVSCAAKKGDGKRPKKKTPVDLPVDPQTYQQSQQQSQQQSSAPRVDPNLNIPVRKQIKLAKALKEIEQIRTSYRRPPSAAPVTSYRKETKTPEQYKSERKEQELKEAELSKLPSKNFALRSLYFSDTSPSSPTVATTTTRLPPILLVDGYNVLYKWDKTSAYMKSGDLFSARNILIDSMITYSQANGIRVVVAFDAMGGMNAGALSEELLSSGVTVAYCGNCEADTYIEAQVSKWLDKGYPTVIVATSDALHSMVVRSKSGTGALGDKQMCVVVPSSGLIKDVEATHARIKEKFERLDIPSLCLLGEIVKGQDDGTFDKLEEMKSTLPSLPMFRLQGRRSGKKKRNNNNSGSGSEGSGSEGSGNEGSGNESE